MKSSASALAAVLIFTVAQSRAQTAVPSLDEVLRDGISPAQSRSNFDRVSEAYRREVDRGDLINDSDPATPDEIEAMDQEIRENRPALPDSHGPTPSEPLPEKAVPPPMEEDDSDDLADGPRGGDLHIDKDTDGGDYTGPDPDIDPPTMEAMRGSHAVQVEALAAQIRAARDYLAQLRAAQSRREGS